MEGLFYILILVIISGILAIIEYIRTNQKCNHSFDYEDVKNIDKEVKCLKCDFILKN